MKQPPTARPKPPSPRTLAATPPTMLRAPRPSISHGRFPALAVALAGGVVLPACESPQCGTTRAEELASHGLRGARDLGQLRPVEALSEIGVALGVLSHGRASHAMTSGGTPQVVRPTAQVVPPPADPTLPSIMADGEMGATTPLPVQSPAPARVTHPVTHPAPHQSPSRGGPRRVNPHPVPTPAEPMLEGTSGRVGPLPSDLTSPRVTRA